MVSKFAILLQPSSSVGVGAARNWTSKTEISMQSKTNHVRRNDGKALEEAGGLRIRQVEGQGEQHCGNDRRTVFDKNT